MVDPWSSRHSLSAFLGMMGVAHVAASRPFEQLVPRWLPGSAAVWNLAAASAELASAGLLARRRTARTGGWAALATIAVVWVANIQAALDGGTRGVPGWLGGRVAAWIRVPLQLPLLWWAYRCTGPARSGRSG